MGETTTRNREYRVGFPILDEPFREELRRRGSFNADCSAVTETEGILAEKGFYRTPNTTNRIQCFSCSSTLEFPLQFPVSNIDVEHNKLNPNCAFLKHPSQSGNIPRNLIEYDGPGHFLNYPTPPRYSQLQSQSIMDTTQRMLLSSPPRNDLNLYNRSSINYELMKSEYERYRTFFGIPSWPVSYINPVDCARAGFFFLQNGDKVQCAFCRGIAGEWDEGDVPILEHRRHFPRCPFICNLPVGNIPIGEESDVGDIDPSALGVDVCGHGRFEEDPGSEGFQESPHIGGSQPLSGNFDDVATNLSIEPCRGPVHMNLVTYQARLKSFTEMRWPESTGQAPERMSAAGFYYIGSRDHVKCFYCGGGLRNWEANDDPWVEHARWFPRCTFVVLNKGHEFIKSVLDKSHPNPAANSVAETEVLETTRSSAASSSGIESGSSGSSEKGCSRGSTSSGNSSGEEDEDQIAKARDLEEEVRKLREQRQCKICMDNEVSVVFLPCGHLVSCTACATAFTNCALCRQSIKAVVRTYMS